MNSYFHAYTKKYNIRFRYAVVLTVTPLAETSVLAAWTIIFNLKSIADGSFFFPLAALICGSVLAGMLLCWLYYELEQRAIARNSRYTYFEICRKAAIFSRYAGEYTNFGEKTIMRRVYVIPLKSFENAYLDEKKKHLVLTGEIRFYCENSDNLGYHVIDGDVVFDKWLNNEKGFEKLNVLKLPEDFAHPSKIAKELLTAKDEFLAIPEKKPYVFREADIVKKRRELKKIQEARRYLRTW